MRELDLVRDREGNSLQSLVRRVPAVDARDAKQTASTADVDPLYSLRAQLTVAPDERLARAFDLDLPIRMTAQEVAVARSHIETWKSVARGYHERVLVLEDDFYLRNGACAQIDRAFRDLIEADPDFDLLYVSYREVDGGAEARSLGPALKRPARGLWYLSGYVLSRKGAERLLRLMPVVGPVDLWINLQFSELAVYATSRSLIEQRRDGPSDNAYSVLPLLSRAGIVDSGIATKGVDRPEHEPFLVLDHPGTVHSTTMAFSILGVTCRLGPPFNQADGDRTVGAYVCTPNDLGAVQRFLSKEPAIRLVSRDAGTAKVTRAMGEGPQGWPQDLLSGATSIGRPDQEWKPLMDFLGLEHPGVPFPDGAFPDQRLFHQGLLGPTSNALAPFDDSPWIERGTKTSGAERSFACYPVPSWIGHSVAPLRNALGSHWHSLRETFPGNLALFDPGGVTVNGEEVTLTLCQRSSDVRQYSSGSVASRHSFLYGRLEAEIRPSAVPGAITGFFFHRSCPRQEIDLEILGSDPTVLIANVYFNPGDDGMDIAYGYRGTPIRVGLGFDASERFHHYAIEWTGERIRWVVDGMVVHERESWRPTPIPHLPMTAFVNLWSSHARELGGMVRPRDLPTTTTFRNLTVRSMDIGETSLLEERKGHLGSGRMTNGTCSPETSDVELPRDP